MTNTTDIQQTPVVDGSLDVVSSLDFTKREWLIIFNVLSRQEYRLGDALLVMPIVDKIAPIVTEIKEEMPNMPNPDINLGK
jgi:hypothetical protein